MKILQQDPLKSQTLLNLLGFLLYFYTPVGRLLKNNKVNILMHLHNSIFSLPEYLFIFLLLAETLHQFLRGQQHGRLKVWLGLFVLV